MKRRTQKTNCKSGPNLKRRRQNYSPRKLKKAILKVQKGGVSISQISKEYNIPRTTLLYKSNGKRRRNAEKPGPKPMLGIAGEEELSNWIMEISKRGYPLTKEALLYSAGQLLKTHGQKVHNYNDEKGPGRRWFQSFMDRNSHLTIRTAEYLHKGRAKTSERSIRKWFEEISLELKDDLSVFDNPSRIFNCDETSVFLHPKSRPVIAKRGQRNVYDASGRCNKENMTVLLTGNAAGEIVPPMAVVSFKKIPSDIATAANPEWAIGRTQNGWMTSESFFEYIANIFEPYLQKKNITKPVILFFDGHSSHLSLQLSQFCREHDIILVSLPPNATHILQPLDVAVFGPLKKNWNRKLEKFRLEKQIEQKKCHVLPILESVLVEEAFKANLKKGFERCGLCPLDSNAVDYSKCLGGDEFTVTPQFGEDDLSDDSMLLQQFEQRLPISLKNEFDNCSHRVTDKWTGSVKLYGLFEFYRSIKYSLNFEDTICDELDEMLGVEPLNWDEEDVDRMYYDVPGGENLECNEEAIDVFPYNCDVINGLDVNNAIDLDVSVSSNHNSDGAILLLDNSNKDDTPIANDGGGSQDNCLANDGGGMRDGHRPSTSIENASLILSCNLEMPIAAVARVTSTPVTPSSRGSTSSKSSINDILNSIVRYKDNDSPEKTKRHRKKLKLPSVMTGEKWIELKDATEQEKIDEEKRKQDRKKQRKLVQMEEEKRKQERKKQRKLAQEEKERIKLKAKKLKHVKSKSSKPKSSLKRKSFEPNRINIISKVTENFTEVEVGTWAVIEFKVSNAPNRNFIGKIIKVVNGNLFAKFVRPKNTRDHSGYIFEFPQVEDVSRVSISQIKMLLPDPGVYGRGLLKFCIHAKDL